MFLCTGPPRSQDICAAQDADANHPRRRIRLAAAAFTATAAHLISLAAGTGFTMPHQLQVQPLKQSRHTAAAASRCSSADAWRRGRRRKPPGSDPVSGCLIRSSRSGSCIWLSCARGCAAGGDAAAASAAAAAATLLPPPRGFLKPLGGTHGGGSHLLLRRRLLDEPLLQAAAPP